MDRTADSNATVDRHGLAILDDEECLRLLGAAHVGRIGLSAHALPVILPVNFVIDGAVAVFFTEPGLKLEAARRGTVACLQADGFDRFCHDGWSVMATGRLRELTEPDDLARAARLPLTPWALKSHDHYVTLALELLSGRRIRSAP